MFYLLIMFIKMYENIPMVWCAQFIIYFNKLKKNSWNINIPTLARLIMVSSIKKSLTLCSFVVKQKQKESWCTRLINLIPNRYKVCHCKEPKIRQVLHTFSEWKEYSMLTSLVKLCHWFTMRYMIENFCQIVLF